MSLIGFENLHYAELTKDDSTGVTYGEVKALPGAVSINEDAQVEVAKLYADNRLWETAQVLQEGAVELVVADLPASVYAALGGHSVDTNGKITYTADDSAPYFSIMGEFLMGDGETKRYFKLLKGQFSEPGLEGETKNENTEFRTFTLNATFMPRKYDNKYKYIIDSSATNTSVTSAWYDSVE